MMMLVGYIFVSLLPIIPILIIIYSPYYQKHTLLQIGPQLYDIGAFFSRPNALVCLTCSPSESQMSYGSAANNFGNFQHPSHELLKENNFVWQVYHRYHAKCLKGVYHWVCAHVWKCENALRRIYESVRMCKFAVYIK